MREVGYNRQAAVEYAQKWAFGRNPRYLDFEELGGDCTNYVSQCIYSGAGVMNSTPTFGWYYYSSQNRAPAWTGVEYIYNFLTSNKSVGPYGIEVSQQNVRVGDIVQLGNYNGHFYHTPIIVAVGGDEIYVAAHTFDAYMRPLSSYEYEVHRFVHIQGVRDY